MCAFTSSHVISFHTGHKTFTYRGGNLNHIWFIKFLCFFDFFVSIWMKSIYIQMYLQHLRNGSLQFAIYTITLLVHRVTFYKSMSFKIIGGLVFPFFFSHTAKKQQAQSVLDKLPWNIVLCYYCYTTTLHDCIVPEIFT